MSRACVTANCRVAGNFSRRVYRYLPKFASGRNLQHDLVDHIVIEVFPRLQIREEPAERGTRLAKLAHGTVDQRKVAFPIDCEIDLIMIIHEGRVGPDLFCNQGVAMLVVYRNLLVAGDRSCHQETGLAVFRGSCQELAGNNGT